MINKKLTALRLEKELLEKQLTEAATVKTRWENLEVAARKAYELLKSARTACTGDAKHILKELLQQCVRRLVVHFKSQKYGKRTYHIPTKGVLELYTLKGLAVTTTSPSNHGDP
jgi:DNA repair exonuclease SbcCD ATPase subunit